MRFLLPALILASGLPACSGRSATATAASATGTSAPALPVPTADEAAGADAGVTAAPTAAAPEIPSEVASAAPTERPPCPEGMALVQRFCIDRFEATLWAQGDAGVMELLPHSRRPPEDVRYEARSVPDVLPQAYISRNEAKQACTNAGKRLCSMAEWRRTCQGKGSAHWPYGRKAVAGNCNHLKAHLLSLRFGSDAKRWTYANFNDPSLDEEPGFLAKTGAYAACATSEDVRDLVGNLHEWVSDIVDEKLVAAMEAEDVERVSQPWKEGNGIFMGGFFSTADQHGEGCTFTTIAHEPRYHDYSIGFRCCAAADLPPPPKKAPRKRH